MRERLRKALAKAVDDPEPDNLVYRVAKSKVIRDVVAADDSQKYIPDRLETIESALSSMAARDARRLRPTAPRKIRSYADYPYYIEVIVSDGEREKIGRILDENLDIAAWSRSTTPGLMDFAGHKPYLALNPGCCPQTPTPSCESLDPSSELRGDGGD